MRKPLDHVPQQSLLDVPESVEHFSVIPDAEELVGGGYPVGISPFGVPEEGVRDPDATDHVGVECQSLQGAVEAQAPVVPRLGKEDVNGVFLGNTGKNGVF